MKRLYEILWAIFHPAYWKNNHPYSKEWDAFLVQLMDEYEFEPIDEYKARLGPVEVWVENHPRASFYQYRSGPRVLPKRITRHRAYNKLQKDTLAILKRDFEKKHVAATKTALSLIDEEDKS